MPVQHILGITLKDQLGKSNLKGYQNKQVPVLTHGPAGHV